MNRGQVKRWGPHIVAGCVLALGVWYGLANPEILQSLLQMDALHLALAGAALLVSFYLGGLQLGLFLRHYGLHAPWRRSVGLYILMGAGNLVTPMRGGSGVLAVYLKTQLGLNYARFGLILMGTYALAGLVNGALAAVGVGLTWWLQGWVSVPLLVISVGLVAAILLTLVVPRLPHTERRPWSYLVRFSNAWHELFRDRSFLLKILVVTLLQTLVQVVGYMFIYRGLGLEVSPAAMLTIVALGTVAAMVPLLPASLGTYDAAMIGLLAAYGLSVGEASPGLVVFRGLSFVLLFGLAAVFWPLLRPAVKKAAAGEA